MRSLEPGWQEFELMAKDSRRIESLWSNLRLSDGTYIGIDSRERKRAEISLKENEARLREAQKLVQMGSYIVDRQKGTISYCSEEMFRIFERAPEMRLPSIDEALGYVYAPEFQERIFVIFQRLHAREAYPGTGIGLGHYARKLLNTMAA